MGYGDVVVGYGDVVVGYGDVVVGVCSLGDGICVQWGAAWDLVCNGLLQGAAVDGVWNVQCKGAWTTGSGLYGNTHTPVVTLKTFMVFSVLM